MTERRDAAAIHGTLPLYLTREQAAWFVGVSPNIFDYEVTAGRWPKGIIRGKKCGRVTWYRPDIEAAAERLDRRIGRDTGGKQSFESWRDSLPRGRQGREEEAR